MKQTRAKKEKKRKEREAIATACVVVKDVFHGQLQPFGGDRRRISQLEPLQLCAWEERRSKEKNAFAQPFKNVRNLKKPQAHHNQKGKGRARGPYKYKRLYRMTEKENQ